MTCPTVCRPGCAGNWGEPNAPEAPSPQADKPVLREAEEELIDVRFPGPVVARSSLQIHEELLV